MAWIMDTYSMHKRHTVNAVVTGKPIAIGGSRGRREATGRGVMLVVKEALREQGLPLKGSRVLVQGFGNVGSVAAALLEQEGLTIVGISDKTCGVYNANGIAVADALDVDQDHRFLDGFPAGETITNEQLLELECRGSRPGGARERHQPEERGADPREDHRARAPTARSPLRPTPSSTTWASSSCRTSSPTPAA